MARKKKVEPRKILTEAEMIRFDLNGEANKRRKLETDLLTLQKRIVEQQRIILDKDIKILENKMLMLKNVHNIERNEHVNFYNELCKELELTKGFGFNPDTGEIVID